MATSAARQAMTPGHCGFIDIDRHGDGRISRPAVLLNDLSPVGNFERRIRAILTALRSTLCVVLHGSGMKVTREIAIWHFKEHF